MSTYRDLQDRIALDYLNRTDLRAEVKRAIQSAIRSYESYRLWFNETASATTTTANTSFFSVPSDFLQIDRIEISYAGAWTQLISRTFDEIRDMNAVSAASSLSVPTHYAYRGNRFELALIPDSAYSVMCYYVHSLPTLSADSDTNAWTTEAENLIAHHAVLDLVGGTLVTINDRQIEYHEKMLMRATNDLNLRNTTRTQTRLASTKF